MSKCITAASHCSLADWVFPSSIYKVTSTQCHVTIYLPKMHNYRQSLVCFLTEQTK